MGWASDHINKLKNGETVSFTPYGNSMKGRVRSGQRVTVSPADSYEIDDVVLCKVNGRQYLHLIKNINNERYLIGNNVGGINGWTHEDNIYGRLVE